MLKTDVEKLDGLRTYMDGKHTRYRLLFAVNGGAFALARLIGESENGLLLGRLSLSSIAVGSMLFTVVTAVDIWTWGAMMSRLFLGKLAFT